MEGATVRTGLGVRTRRSQCRHAEGALNADPAQPFQTPRASVSRYPKVSLAAVNVESAYDAHEGRLGFEPGGTRDPFLILL